LANVEGRTFSVTSAAAPKDAKKAFEKGRELDKKKKLAEAQKEYEKAVAAYPKYANAWFELGTIHERQNQPAEARKAYQESINSDSKLVKPYVQLSHLAAQEKDWKGCAEISEKALKLNPYDFPQVYFYSAVANYNLQNLDAAEKNARDGVKADTDKRIPRLRQLLGVVLAQKNDVPGAMEQLKSYMSMLPPNSQELTQAKGQIAQLEKLAQNQAGQPAKPAEGQQQ
jgi:tetratricopeptide (TPR) repeat protein